MYYFFPSIGGNVCGIPSDTFNEAIVEENKVEIDLIISSLRQNRKKVKEFQWGSTTTDINFELDNDDSSSIIMDDDDDCSHVLIFDQKESGSHGQLDNEMIIRLLFLCMVDHWSLRLPEILQFFSLASLHSKIERHCIFHCSLHPG